MSCVFAADFFNEQDLVNKAMVGLDDLQQVEPEGARYLAQLRGVVHRIVSVL